MSWETKRGESVITRSGDAVQIDEGLRKYMLQVYNYMTIGLLITAFVSYFLAHSSLSSVFYHVSRNSVELTITGWIAILSPFALIVMMQNAISNGKGSMAFMLFCAFSVLEGISLTTIFWVYSPMAITRMFLVTAGTFAGMSLYGYTTKRDLTRFGSFLTMGLWGLLLATLTNIFIRSSSFDLTLSCLGVLLFVGLTAFDTWKIRNIYNENDTENVMVSKAVFGALDLYLDFLNLFLYLLRLFGRKN